MCNNREAQSWDFKQQKETLKWQKLLSPACSPEHKALRSVWLPEERLHDSAARLPPLGLRHKRKPEHSHIFPLTIISCIMVITTAVLLTNSCPKQIVWLLWDGKNI